ncbi:MAG: hypothetical protein FWD53_10575 [Phycisphaerales bacterium]|nr:hypothetical protein [Phycisphaerales bacterium]
MPLLVTSQDLQPGMRLAEAFRLNGRTMLPGGKVLNADDIEILQRKYTEIIFKVGDPVLDSLVEFEDDTREREVATTVTHQIQSTMTDVQQKFGQRTDMGGVDFSRIKNTVSSVVEFLHGNPVSAALINRTASGLGYLPEHAGNVFYLSMVLGAAVRDYVVRERQRQTSASTLTQSVATDLKPLGLGAMFLDIAMTQLPQIFDERYELTDADRKFIREHPKAGADLLPETFPPVTKMIVRNHHENCDGTGYPDSLPGERLHVFSRIVRICDAFDAATSQKYFKAAKSPARVLWEMAYGPYQNCYDPTLMRVFLSIIQPFPIGTLLTLEDGRGAVVTKYNRQSPFAPTVLVAFDPHGVKLSQEKLTEPVTIGEGNSLKLKSAWTEDLSFLQDKSPLPAQRSTALNNLLEMAYP